MAAAFRRGVLAALLASVTPLWSSPVHADPATDKARGLYETGLELFYAREHAQALIEFQRAHEVKPRPATLFMMGQCEYLLGLLREAREHYQAYLRDSPTGEFVEVAKDRVESINRRPATLVINTVPDQVDVGISAADQTGAASPASGAPAPNAGAAPASPVAAGSALVSGQAPNNFAVPRGRWLVSVSKPNYQPQRLVIEVEVAETKPLFFKLEPIPARLEIETAPVGATLWVNGNRAQNPYRQNVAPGRFEIFAEAPDYEARTEEFILNPGDRRRLTGRNAFRLRYVQRSGRPELVFASAVMGGLIGAGAVVGTVYEAQENSKPGAVAAVSLSLGGALVGTIGGALLANRFVPSYMPDNRALFVIGGMWIGAAEGALTGIYVRQVLTTATPTDKTTVAPPQHLERPKLSRQLKAAFGGSLPGIVVGTTAAALLSHHAPTYGRVALIQSAAVGGAVAGSLTAVALKWQVFTWRNEGGVELAKASVLDLALPAAIGLNVGLAAGLLGAYLPDQSRYGPSWNRIALIDLAAGAGALAAGIGACVADSAGCLTTSPNSEARARTASMALAGGAVGLLSGILLTRNVDTSTPDNSNAPPPPSVAILPVPQSGGRVTPMLSAFGLF
jgi:hypothetical protein